MDPKKLSGSYEIAYVPRPHANVGANVAIAQRIKHMSPDALRRSLIDAGVPVSNDSKTDDQER